MEHATIIMPQYNPDIISISVKTHHRNLFNYVKTVEIIPVNLYKEN